MKRGAGQTGHRPPRLLLLVLAGFCVENLARAALSVSQAPGLAGLPTLMSPWYLAAIGVFWGAAFGANLIVVWLRPEWAIPVSLSVMTLYQASLWLSRLAFTRSGEAQETVGFHAILTVASFVALAAGLAMARRGASQGGAQQRDR